MRSSSRRGRRWYINAEDEELRHTVIKLQSVEQTRQKVYQAYQEACDRAGLVKELRRAAAARHDCGLTSRISSALPRALYQYPLVDEFQDTNNIQYAWIRLLAGDTGKVMIVGDDDQSIMAGTARR